MNYGFVSKKLQLSGETATGDCGALATINTLSYRATGDLDLCALQRFYSKKYYSLYSESFSEGGRVQDESGFYVGMNWHPSEKFRLLGYFDFASIRLPLPRMPMMDSCRQHTNVEGGVCWPGID